MINIISFTIFILSFILLIESLASKRFTKQVENLSLWENSKVAIVIPAHNEEQVISTTLLTIIPQVKENDQLILIADNCDDRTAEIATEMGVMVKERKDEHNRGKGYALDYGLKQLQNNPPDVVIFIDADSLVNSQCIRRLTEQAILSGMPVQGLYLMETPARATPKDQISAFAFKVKNLVRPLGLSHLQQPCLLTGTGMAFPWDVIMQVNLASGNIVEDMKLGIDLAIAGYPPQFSPQAQIKGRLPSQLNSSIVQRKRWEHGHLQALLHYVPLLVKESIQQKRLNLLIMALDLAIPPLSLFVFLWLAIWSISLLMFVFADILLPLIISTISGLIIITAIASAWIKFGQEDLPLTTLIKAPLYILWKIPLYFQFLFNREKQWIRTERGDL
jgi:cellulose synthase/poly-beta-1,6-N-acetylglucosamine synthase-like glycosyltransferase